MKKIVDFSKRIGMISLSFALPLLAKAAPAQPAAAGTGSDRVAVPSAGITSVQSVLDFLCIIFGWMFYFLIALAVLFVVIAGYRYLTASGEPEKVKEANNTILYAAIAIGVALLAKAIPLIVGSFFGANTLGLTTC